MFTRDVKLGHNVAPLCISLDGVAMIAVYGGRYNPSEKGIRRGIWNISRLLQMHPIKPWDDFNNQ